MPLRGLAILVVGIDSDSREITGKMLKALGAMVVVADDGTNALRKLVTLSPDLILCDLSVQATDGFDFARHIRNDPRYGRVRLVAVTAPGDEGTSLRLWGGGFDGRVEKPVTLQKLDDLARFLSGGQPRTPSRPARVESLADAVRDKLSVNALPCEEPVKTRQGYGSGQTCSACDAIIRRAQIEYEIQMPDKRVFPMHMGCHGLWLAERIRPRWAHPSN
jgi:CheY-like chemotaxis protein